jgi:hypothetical protein
MPDLSDRILDDRSTDDRRIARMQISFILASLWLSGGERIIVEFAKRLSLKGHTVVLIIPGGTLDSEMSRMVCQAQTRGERKMGLQGPPTQLSPLWKAVIDRCGQALLSLYQGDF